MPTHVDFFLDAPFGGETPDSGPARVLRDQYGTDIMFRGKLIATPAGDYQEISGIENLRQSIYRRLYTPKGAYKPYPEYGVGVPVYLREKLTGTVLGRLEHDIRTNLTQDRRIARVVDVTLTPFTDNYGGQALQINITVEALGQVLKFTPFSFSQNQ